MIIPDINVLVYAFRPEEANHPDYAVWLHGVTQAWAWSGSTRLGELNLLRPGGA